MSVRRSVGGLDVAQPRDVHFVYSLRIPSTSYYTCRFFFLSLVFFPPLAIKCVPTFIKLCLATEKYQSFALSLSLFEIVKISPSSCGILQTISCYVIPTLYIYVRCINTAWKMNADIVLLFFFLISLVSFFFTFSSFFFLWNPHLFCVNYYQNIWTIRKKAYILSLKDWYEMVFVEKECLKRRKVSSFFNWVTWYVERVSIACTRVK